MIVYPDVLENECYRDAAVAESGFECREFLMENAFCDLDVPVCLLTRCAYTKDGVPGPPVPVVPRYNTRNSVSRTMVKVYVYTTGRTSFAAVCRRMLFSTLRDLPSPNHQRCCSRTVLMRLTLEAMASSFSCLRADGLFPVAWRAVSAWTSFCDDDGLAWVSAGLSVSDQCGDPESHPYPMHRVPRDLVGACTTGASVDGGSALSLMSVSSHTTEDGRRYISLSCI